MFEIVGREEQKFNQWEQGVKLSNPCMKAGDEVVFRNSSGATYVMIAESGGVEVPNKMLQMTCNILVDLKQGKEQHDDCQTVFEVNPAEKPDDYVYVDNTIRKQEVQSGGGSGIVVIPVTWNDEGEDYTVGMTFQEIRAALDSGAVVIVKDDLGGVWNLSTDEGEWIDFTRVLVKSDCIVSSYFGFSPESDQYFSNISNASVDLEINHG